MTHHVTGSTNAFFNSLRSLKFNLLPIFEAKELNVLLGVSEDEQETEKPTIMPAPCDIVDHLGRQTALRCTKSAEYLVRERPFRSRDSARK